MRVAFRCISASALSTGETFLMALRSIRSALWVSKVLGLCVLLFVTGCTQPKTERSAPKPPEVLVSQPTVQEVTDYEDFTGRVEAIKSVEVRARVSGYLEAFRFQEGRDVKEGDVLFEIDDRPYKAALEQAVAEVALKEAQFQKANADFQRARGTFDRDAISRSEYDIAVAALASTKADISVANAKQTQAELDFAWTKVTAPISGQISRRMVDPGNLVQADVTPLTTIVATDQVYIHFDIDERTLLRLRRLIRDGRLRTRDQRKLLIRAELADETGFPHEGEVDFSDNRVDPATGTLRLRGVFKNPELTSSAGGYVRRMMSPGLFARVRLPIGDPHRGTLIPEQALASDQGQKYVYVVNREGDAIRRDIQVGTQHGAMREVQSGLKPEDWVIVSGVQRVRPKVKVRATPYDDFKRAAQARLDQLAGPTTTAAAEAPSSGGQR